MGLTYSRVVRAEPGEVFAWHSRPGAITRPLPPWQPARVVREAPSVRDGQAVLLSTGGRRVIRLIRRPPRHDGERQWRPDDPDPGLLAGSASAGRSATTPAGSPGSGSTTCSTSTCAR